MFGSKEIDDYNDDVTPLLLPAFSPLPPPIPGNDSHSWLNNILLFSLLLLKWHEVLESEKLPWATFTITIAIAIMITITTMITIAITIDDDDGQPFQLWPILDTCQALALEAANFVFFKPI